MSMIDDYKQLRMIENIKNFKEMEIAYKSNLKLCKYQEQQINKLATCIEQIEKILEDRCKVCPKNISCDECFNRTLLNKISECEVKNENIRNI